jgi:hypothetical protein
MSEGIEAVAAWATSYGGSPIRWRTISALNLLTVDDTFTISDDSTYS